jgi:hypothetical protein
VKSQSGQAWSYVDESPSHGFEPSVNDRAVCGVLRYVRDTEGLTHVDAFDLAAMLGLDLEAALARCQPAEEGPQS